MRITVFGTGYVGLVTGTCFADEGNEVICVDIDQGKIDLLNQGQTPIYEPGLDELVKRNSDGGRLLFTTDAEKGVNHAEIIFIAVGTPENADGSADLQYVLSVAKTIGIYLNEYKVVVDKSTVPVGTGDKVESVIQGCLKDRGIDIEFDVVSNPEFLKEGAAIQDFIKPDRVVIGADYGRAAHIMRDLYGPFQLSRDRMLIMDRKSAELTKYAANVMLATKVSLMNELSNVAEAVGADIEMVRRGIGADQRIGYHFIYPGCGFGGSCFPKDVAAISNTADGLGCDTPIIDGVLKVNSHQKMVIPNKIIKHFGELKGRTFALWGLSFKPDTDDMREAPSRVLMEFLWKNGAKVRVYDPEAMGETKKIYGERKDLHLCDSSIQAVEEAEALIIMTEWRLFRNPDFNEIKKKLIQPVIFDGRNIYDPNEMTELGITYYGIGRGQR